MKLENFKNGYDVTNGSVLALNEKNDCVVRAFANAFTITYDTAHQFAENVFNRKAKKGVKGMFITLSKLGFATFDLFQDSLFPETKTYSIHPITRNKDGKVVNTDYTHKTVNHTVKDGIVIDNPNYKFEGYRRIVESACEVK